MEEADLIFINDFLLKYDGIFTVEFTYENVVYCPNVYMPLEVLVKILKNEGIIDNLSNYDFYNEGVLFKETTIVLEVVKLSDGQIPFVITEETEQFEKYMSNTRIYKCYLKESL